MNTKIISLGTMYLDINAKNFPIQDGLLPHTEIVGGDYELVPGGSALNFARICASLKLQPTFIGKTGNDAAGDILTNLVTKTGITPAFIRSSSVTTNIGVNYVDTNGESIMTVLGTANHTLSGEDIVHSLKKDITDAAYLYLGGCFKLKNLLHQYAEIIEIAKQANVQIIMDHGRITADVTEEEMIIMKSLIKDVSIYLPSKEEFLKLWDITSIEEGLSIVQKETQALVVVKDAENGAYSYSENKLLQVPAFQVTVVNTVGAGDSFNAGFITAQSEGKTLEESMRYACATAALKISQNSLPDREAVEVLLHN